MQKIVKTTLFALMALLMLSLTVGCNEKDAVTEEPETAPSSELSQEDLQQILADSMLAYPKVDSYKANLDLTMLMEMTGGTESGKTNVSMKAASSVSQATKEMQMTMNMSVDMDTGEAENPLQDVSMEMYMLPESLYMKLDVPGMGEQWMKMSVTPELMDVYNLDLIDKQLSQLDSPAEIEFLKYETFDGSECYVLNIIPDMEKLIQWLSQQQTGNLELDWENIERITDAFKEVSYTGWIEKETKLLKKLNITMLIEFDPDQTSQMESGFEKMTMNIDMKMTMFDYNIPVSIDLPEEALGAMEIPSGK